MLWDNRLAGLSTPHFRSYYDVKGICLAGVLGRLGRFAETEHTFHHRRLGTGNDGHWVRAALAPSLGLEEEECTRKIGIKWVGHTYAGCKWRC